MGHRSRSPQALTRPERSQWDLPPVLRLFHVLHLHPVPLGMSISGIPVTQMYWEGASSPAAELQLPHMLLVPVQTS